MIYRNSTLASPPLPFSKGGLVDLISLQMSSWERSRYIPWDRIPLPDTRIRQPGEASPLPLDDERERIMRKLHREAALLPSEVEKENKVIEADESSMKSTNLTGTAAASSALNNTDCTKVLYSHADLLRQAAFGGCVGTITGCVFGFMDGMRTAGESPILRNASNMAKGRFLLQGTTRSAALFGTFFGAYHIVRYSIRVALNPGEIGEICLASPFALASLWAYPPTRHALPYGAMLIAMDGFNLAMRKHN